MFKVITLLHSYFYNNYNPLIYTVVIFNYYYYRTETKAMCFCFALYFTVLSNDLSLEENSARTSIHYGSKKYSEATLSKRNTTATTNTKPHQTSQSPH